MSHIELLVLEQAVLNACQLEHGLGILLVGVLAQVFRSDVEGADEVRVSPAHDACRRLVVSHVGAAVVG